VKWEGLSNLLDRIVHELHRFLVMPQRDAQIITLWLVHTHVFLHDVFDHTPHLIVWSQSHGCAKTTLRSIISRLAPNVEAVDTVRGTELIAFLRRQAAFKNDEEMVELFGEYGILGLGTRIYLFDEAERYDYTGLLIRIINAAHNREGGAWASDGSKVPIFSPMALFRRRDPRYIRDLHPTISRCVLVEMKQRDPLNPAHKCEEFRDRNRHVRYLAVLRQAISAMVQDQLKRLQDWRPEDDFLSGNRLADNWEPLCAIADIAGCCAMDHTAVCGRSDYSGFRALIRLMSGATIGRAQQKSSGSNCCVLAISRAVLPQSPLHLRVEYYLRASVLRPRGLGKVGRCTLIIRPHCSYRAPQPLRLQVLQLRAVAQADTLPHALAPSLNVLPVSARTYFLFDVMTIGPRYSPPANRTREDEQTR
jgi:hypothetical protein